jgi:pimeloyl-ACP methyl ester carboxylesterase
LNDNLQNMKKITLSLALSLLCLFLHAQDFSGNWYGTLDIPGQKLRLTLHVKADGSAFSTTLDSPDQKLSGLPTDKTTISGEEITVEASKLGIVYRGTINPAGDELKGTFTQGQSIPLNFSRKEHVIAAAKRPQYPADFPYSREEVTINNAKSGNTLAGTLTMPSDKKASAIVIMISGSGAQNRDEELMGHKPFLVWSDYLTRKGIAVLRYDDRGVGKSTGIFATATTADFADDAEAAVEFIRSRAGLKGLKIGLVGHSEGGLIAPIVASRNPSLGFIVLLAGPGIPITELMIKQNEDQLKVSGMADNAIIKAVATNRMIYTAVNKYQSLPKADFKVKLDSLMSAEFHRDNTSNASDDVIKQRVAALSNQLSTPWFRYFMAFNPQDYLSKVKCPVLAINGTRDLQVNAESNLQGIRDGLTKAGNKNFEIYRIQNLNHLLQLAKTGAVSEYSEIEETVNLQALDKVSGWIQSLK